MKNRHTPAGVVVLGVRNPHTDRTRAGRLLTAKCAGGARARRSLARRRGLAGRDGLPRIRAQPASQAGFVGRSPRC